MGGGLKSSSSFTSSPDDDSSLEDDQSHCRSDGLGFDQLGNHENSSNKAPLVGNLRKRHDQLPNLVSNCISSMATIETPNEAKEILMSYSPGSWIDKEEGENLSDFDVPKTTTLLVVGFRGSGKSSLVNRISRLFGDASDRAQVSYGSSLGDGTCFLHGYLIPRLSGSFCLFDTRSLSDQVDNNDGLIKSWMTNGVRHGELVIKELDDLSLKEKLACKIRYGSALKEPVRKVNSVIYVVDGQSILRCMKDDNEESTRHCQMLARTYNSPYFSFRDDKPTIVVTRGDLLIHEEREGVRMYLGELLSVPPETQIFNIPESNDSITDLNTLKMLKYTLERADKNLPRKNRERRNLSRTNSSSRQALKIFIMFLIVGAVAWAVSDIQHYPTWSNQLESLVNRTHHLQESLDNRTRYCNLHNQTLNLDLQNPQVQAKPSQRKIKDKTRKPQAKPKAKAHKQREAVESEPTISWEARQRLWFQE